jgi:hypothetical protein
MHSLPPDLLNLRSLMPLIEVVAHFSLMMQICLVIPSSFFLFRERESEKVSKMLSFSINQMNSDLLDRETEELNWIRVTLLL